jgi:hypothetical protein
MVFITVVESVYSAVRTDALYKEDYVSFLKGQRRNTVSISFTIIVVSHNTVDNRRENKNFSPEDYSSSWIA